MSAASSWQEKEVRQVGEVVTGTTPSTKKPEYYGDEYKLISPADLDSGKYVTTAHRMLSALGLAQCRVLPKDTVLVGCIGNVGKIGMVADAKAATNQQINAVICNQGHDPHFIYYSLLHSRQRLEEAAVKTTVPILNKSNFERFALDIPLFPEQRRIAHVLTTVQTAIEQQARLIALTRELKSALMRKLFTEGLRGEKQKETEIGLVPESWEIQRLRDNAQVKGGKRLPKGHKLVTEKTDYPYLRVTDFGNHSVDVADLRCLLPETQAHIKRYIITDKDVFISIAGTIGVVGMIPPELNGANLTENAARIVVQNKRISPRFLMYFLSTDGAQREIHAQTVKNAQPKLALVRIGSLRIPIPELDEQEEIVQALEVLRQKAILLQQKHNLLEELFRALLHQLMTGQVRLNDLDLPGFS